MTELIYCVCVCFIQVEILVLCVTLLDMLVSTVLILLINAEKRRHEKK